MNAKRSTSRRLMRYIGFGLLNLLVLIIVVALVAPLVFDPNDYKDEIAAQFKQRTGRDLDIVGDMSFSVLPWLGVSTGEIRVGNAEGFATGSDGKTFARLERADVRVKLVPLLSREVQMDTVTVRGLQMHLVRDANGRGNWDDLAGAGDKAQPETGGSASSGDSGPGAATGTLAAFALGGVHIEDAAISWADAQSNEQATLSNIDLRTGEVSIGEPVDVELSLNFAHPAATGKGRGKARLSYDLQTRRVSADGLELSTEVNAPALGVGLSSASISGGISYDDGARQVTATALKFALSAPVPASSGLTGPIELSGAGDVDVRLAEQTVTSPALQLKVQNLRQGNNVATLQLTSTVAMNLATSQLALSGLRGDGEVNGDAIKGGALPITFAGDVNADLPAQSVQVANLKFSAAELKLAGDINAKQINTTPIVSGAIAAPPFALAKVLARIGVSLPATKDPKALQTVAFNGRFNFDGKQIALSPLSIDLDGNAITGKLAATTGGALAFDLSTASLDVDRYLPAAAPGAPPPSAAGALPVGAIRGLDIDGNIKVGALRYAGLDLANVNLGIKAKDSQLRLAPLQANLYGGLYKGDIRIDARKDLPVMHLDEQVSNIDAAALMDALKVSTGALDLRGGRTSMALKTTVTTDAAGQNVRADNVVLDGTVSGRAFRGGAVPIKLRGDITLDLSISRATVKEARAQFAELNVAGDIDTHFAPGKLRYDGTIDLAPFNARSLAARLGIPMPQTNDRKALTAIGVKAAINGNATSLKATNVAMKLDDSSIKGDITVLNFAALALAFNVDIDSINVDDYLPPSAKGKAATPGAAATALPVDLVRSLNIDGQLRVGRLTMGGVKMSKVVLTANAKDGLLKMSPLGAVLYQGRYDGNVTMDARGAAPRISLDETIKGVQIGELLKDVRGDAPITGATDLRATLSAVGGDTEALKRSADGNLSFAIRNGTLENIDMVNSMCTTLAALDFDNLNKQTIAAGVIGLLLNSASSKKSAPSAGGSGGTRTEFTDMSGTATVAKGIATNNDLVMSSPIVRVRGAGIVDLPKDQIDYRAEAELVQSCAGIGKRDLAGQIIPVTITGPINDPNVKPQIPSGLIQALRKRRSSAPAAPAAPTAPSAPTASVPSAPAAPVQQQPPPEPKKPAQQLKDTRDDLLKGLLKGLLK